MRPEEIDCALLRIGHEGHVFLVEGIPLERAEERRFRLDALEQALALLGFRIQRCHVDPMFLGDGHELGVLIRIPSRHLAGVVLHEIGLCPLVRHLADIDGPLTDRMQDRQNLAQVARLFGGVDLTRGWGCGDRRSSGCNNEEGHEHRCESLR